MVSGANVVDPKDFFFSDADTEIFLPDLDSTVRLIF
jgi:hypothetical protein